MMPAHVHVELDEKRKGPESVRIGFIRSILMNHNYPPSRQLSVYLRMLGVAVPSIYGPSADESICLVPEKT